MLENIKCTILALIFKLKNIRCKSMKIGKLSLSIFSDIQVSPSSYVKIGSLALSRYVSIRIRNNSCFSVGKNVYFNNGCILTCRKKIIIGDNCIFGPNVMIFDHDHDIRSNDFRHKFICNEIIIGDNVWIGAGSIILKGAKIGSNTTVAAGSIVTGEVPPNVIFYNQKYIKYKEI